MKKPHGIHPRQPFLRIRMSRRESIALLVLLDSVDREDALAERRDVRAYDNIAFRVRNAKLQFPAPRRSS